MLTEQKLDSIFYRKLGGKNDFFMCICLLLFALRYFTEFLIEEGRFRGLSMIQLNLHKSKL